VSGAKILVVEDEAVVSMHLEARLPQLGYVVSGVAADREGALRLADEHRPDLVLMDVNLGSSWYDGIDLAGELNDRLSVPVVYLTAYADNETLRRAKLTEPFGYVLKPFDLTQLRAAIEMALYRSEMQRKLRERDEWLSATLTSIREGVIATDASGCVQFMNPVAERLTGWPHQEAFGRDIDDVVVVLDERGETLPASPARTALRQGSSTVDESDHVLVTRDGRHLTIVDGAAPISVSSDRQAGVVLALRDITDRKRMEEELLRSNEELQQFAYAASHDLQEPLRTVTTYSQLLERQFEGRLSPDEKEMIGFVVEGARRMNDLVCGLLDYGRLTRQPHSYARFPAREAVKAALENLRAYIVETGATVRYDELPVVTADRSQLIVLFQNLISNGIKYSNGGRAEVRSSLLDTDQGEAFCVADNGIGIAPRHQQRIFGVFTRLHPNRYPGTGIGLAICKRIVEQHHGRIWVESNEGEGTRIYFTLRLSQKTEIPNTGTV
jgi:PAS domain S-box-containing protein